MVVQVVHKVWTYSCSNISHLLSDMSGFFRTCVLRVLSIGPIPSHIAFIMDGNRRYAMKRCMEEGDGHKAGFTTLMSTLQSCYELGVKYVTVYAFSIDNFKRNPDEVQSLMDLMLEKIEALLEEGSIVNQYGIRVYFIGNLKLLIEPVHAAAEKVMKATAHNNKAVLLVCLAYTSRDEILNAVQESCREKLVEIQTLGRSHEQNIVGNELNSVVKLSDIEKNMYMSVAPDPDILVRSSGESRLSNFLLWQTSYTPLYSPTALWPEIRLWHLVWIILNFQRNNAYLEKKRK